MPRIQELPLQAPLSLKSTTLPSALYSCAQARAIDNSAISQAGIPGIVLMKRAGRAALDLLLKKWPEVKELFIFCGRGNNGGDGYVVAALAAAKKMPMQVYSFCDVSELKGDARLAFDFALQEGVSVRPVSEFDSLDCDKECVVVDAILGIGCQGELKESVRHVTQQINSSALPVLSLDLPTGLNGDTGAGAEDSVNADLTLSFVGLKTGLLTGRGPALCGELHFDSLDIPKNIYQSVPCTLERVALSKPLVKRPADAHKGKFGHVLVIGGDTGMGGAAILAAEAALRAGAGVVSLATRPEHITASLARLPEIMARGVESGIALQYLLERASVLVIGPGLGQSAWSQQLLDQALQAKLPMVLDADALNLIAKNDIARLEGNDNWVMTPHPGEAARLLGCNTAEVQNNRLHAVTALQEKYGGVHVLKGAGSLIYGQGKAQLASVGNPGMAVAGMGDVLSGIIGAMLAQGLSVFEAASTGVCAHGAAGDLAAHKGMRGVRATDLMPFIRVCLN